MPAWDHGREMSTGRADDDISTPHVKPTWSAGKIEKIKGRVLLLPSTLTFDRTYRATSRWYMTFNKFTRDEYIPPLSLSFFSLAYILYTQLSQ
jgi:hypothetical protein